MSFFRLFSEIREPNVLFVMFVYHAFLVFGSRRCLYHTGKDAEREATIG
jgi:hypothetical protein